MSDHKIKFSIGFDLYSRNMTPDMLIKYAALADKYDFDVFWLGQENLYRDIFQLLALIARSTKNICIGPSVVNPYTTHPALLVASVATLDEISNGRAYFGLGAGGSAILKPLSIKMWEKPIARLRETILIARKLLRGETVTFDGRILKLNRAKLEFPPKREIPIYLAARGPKMLALAGELADGVNLGAVPAGYIDHAKTFIKEGLNKAGRDFKSIDILNPLMLSLSEDYNEAYEHLITGDPVIKYNTVVLIADSNSLVLEKAGLPPDLNQKINRILIEEGVDAAIKAIPEKAINSFSIVGDIETCIKRIEEYLKVGVTHIGFFQPHGPDIEKAIKLLGEKIIPYIKEQYSYS